MTHLKSRFTKTVILLFESKKTNRKRRCSHERNQTCLVWSSLLSPLARTKEIYYEPAYELYKLG